MQLYAGKKTPATMLTTESTITFPLEGNGEQFNSRLYTITLTDGKASHYEIDNVLTQLFTKAEGASCTCPCNEVSVCLSVGVLLWIFALVLLCYNVIEISHDNIFLSSMFLLVGFISTFACCMEQFCGRIRSKMLQECQDVVDEQNEYFKTQGLRWHLPKEFPQWVELWKDYKLAAFNGENRAVNPPQNRANQDFGEKEDVDLEKGLQKESIEDELELENKNKGSKKKKKDNKTYIPLD